jgi:CheY-like chemotaxis protein
MDAATLEHIFEPFFTTKEVGKGTGLGLATVYGIVQQHHGLIHVKSKPNEGTVFRVFLPVTETRMEDKQKSAPQTIRGGAETILLAEDHDDLRETAHTTLSRIGYRVLVAADGQQAVDLFQTHNGSIDLAILDVVMPKLRGTDAYLKMRALNPGLPVIFTTGYSMDSQLPESGSGNRSVVLQKPYNKKMLGWKVRECLDAV